MRRAGLLLTVAILLNLAAVPAGSAMSPSTPNLSELEVAAQVAPRVAAMSSEATDDVGAIYRLYVAYFDRAPSASGLWFWIDQYREGESLAGISERFAESPEFKTRYGSIDDAGFVALVYESVLDREADAAGLTHWQRQLAGGLGRGAMMVEFSESLEFKVATGFVNVAEIKRLYRAVFLRNPDDSGLRYWVQRRSDGMGIGSIGSEFASSAEFASQYGAVDDAEFVRLVYVNVLGRSPDAAGQEFWNNQLGSITRGDLIIGFSNSSEFQATTRILDGPAPEVPARPEEQPVGTPTEPVDPVPTPVVPQPIVPSPPVYQPPPTPIPSIDCDFAVTEIKILPGTQTTYKAALRYTFNQFGTGCRQMAESGTLTVRGIDASEWTVEGHYLNYYQASPARGSIHLSLPSSAFDQHLGINIDVRFVMTGATQRSELRWLDYVYVPVSHIIESDLKSDPIPFEQEVATRPLTVMANESVPNRPITVQARERNADEGCAPIGSRRDGSWTNVGTGVGQVSVDVRIALHDEIGSCTVDIRVVGANQGSMVRVNRLSPNVDDFAIGGPSSCIDGLCDTTIAFDFVPSRAKYSAFVVPLADVGGLIDVKLPPGRSDAGRVVLPLPHGQPDGFCVAMYASTGSSAFVGTMTPYRCFVPDAGEWLEIPVPDDRFDWD